MWPRSSTQRNHTGFVSVLDRRRLGSEIRPYGQATISNRIKSVEESRRIPEGIVKSLEDGRCEAITAVEGNDSR
jgi:hypothetical protein